MSTCLHYIELLHHFAQGSAELQRKLAQLELDVDRQQGWIRGGSKTDVGSKSQ